MARATQRIVGKASRTCSAASSGVHQTTCSIPSSVWGRSADASSVRSSNQWVRFSSQRAVFGNQ